MTRTTNRFVLCLAALAPLGVASSGAAQQHTEAVALATADEAPAADAAPEPNVMTWDISAGVVLNTGNTRTFAANLGTRFTLRHDANLIAAEAKWIYGIAALRGMTGAFGDWTENANDVNGRVRYDRFLTQDFAVFAAVAMRRDHFAGLDLRMQFQVGAALNFFSEPKHRFWGELGYDMTYDDFFYATPPMPPMTQPADDLIHSARAFVGYDNHVAETLTFRTGLEALVELVDPENTRLNYEAELNAKVAGRLQVGLKFALHFDNVPVSGTGSLDTVTTLNLLYSLVTEEDSAPEPPPEPPPAVDDTAPPADETAPPTDDTVPPAVDAAPPADDTAPPADATAPPASP